MLLSLVRTAARRHGGRDEARSQDGGEDGETPSTAAAGSTKIVKALAVMVAAAMLVEGGVRIWASERRPRWIAYRWLDNNEPDTPRVSENGRASDWEGGCDGEEPSASLDLNLPMCYSSPDANPSTGRWKNCRQGVEASPVHLKNPGAQFEFLRKCDNTWRKENKGQPRPYWEWKPEKCLLDSVTKGKFCAAMDGRKGLLLVGDSLSRLMTSTLAFMLSAESIEADRNGDKWSACDGKLPIRFIRNDFLNARKTNKLKMMHCEYPSGKAAQNTFCNAFTDDGILKQFDTLVVNSGAHFRNSTDYVSGMLEINEVVAKSMKRLHGDAAFMVFRNTVPGHWGCTPRQFEGPVERSVADQLVADAPQEYGWSMFKHNNDIVEGFLIADGWKILDAYTPTVLRADSHIGVKDCLHYCVPGPADHWVTLLYNMLVVERV